MDDKNVEYNYNLFDQPTTIDLYLLSSYIILIYFTVLQRHWLNVSLFLRFSYCKTVLGLI